MSKILLTSIIFDKIVNLLIRIRSQKHIRVSESRQQCANEQLFYEFVGVNVEEDPFAEDFNKEKYFGNI